MITMCLQCEAIVYLTFKISNQRHKQSKYQITTVTNLNIRYVLLRMENL